ncbi:MAG: thymidine phosphorylase [Opitutales bacterium]
MTPADVIRKKRDGETLSREEIAWFIGELQTEAKPAGKVTAYQATAFLMAVYLKGMSARETADLTQAMMDSGTIVDLDTIETPKVDKHSTGGVGDKVSLILAPLATACGLCVPMMSGRGLGHTGGTLDKLASIPGFSSDLSLDAYVAQLESIGVALIGQTRDIVPADKLLYSLRDVTATVESIPLIAASIMSKKLAEGIDSLVLDVKYGSGAFMKTLADARDLAERMVAIGREVGKPTTALLTAMEQPLGHAVGNALEVEEAIHCLRGEGPADLREVTYALVAEMLRLGGRVARAEDAIPLISEAVTSGRALKIFREIIRAQGGDPGVVDDPRLLPRARSVEEATFDGKPGYVHAVDALKIGRAAMLLGAGRASVDDSIDPAVGIDRLVKVGDPIRAGEVLCRLHASATDRLEEAEALVQSAIIINPDPAKAITLIHGKVE